MGNMATIISSHNAKILNPAPTEDPRTCNCQRPDTCPLSGKCLTKCVVYKATVTAPPKPVRHYYGLTEDPSRPASTTTPIIPKKELQERHRTIQIHMGSSGQQPTISNQMGYCTPCSTIQMRHTTMWRLPHRENGDSYSKSSHHAKQEGRNCIHMPPPCQVPIWECSGRPHLNCEIGPCLQPLAPGQGQGHSSLNM